MDGLNVIVRRPIYARAYFINSIPRIFDLLCSTVECMWVWVCVCAFARFSSVHFNFIVVAASVVIYGWCYTQISSRVSSWAWWSLWLAVWLADALQLNAMEKHISQTPCPWNTILIFMLAIAPCECLAMIFAGNGCGGGGGASSGASPMSGLHHVYTIQCSVYAIWIGRIQ